MACWLYYCDLCDYNNTILSYSMFGGCSDMPNNKGGVFVLLLTISEDMHYLLWQIGCLL